MAVIDKKPTLQTLTGISSTIPHKEDMLNSKDESRDFKLAPDTGVQKKMGVGYLRQWLNEDRITDPKKMVTNEELLVWINDVAPIQKKCDCICHKKMAEIISCEDCGAFHRGMPLETLDLGQLRDLIFLEINRAGTAAVRGELNPENNTRSIMERVSSLLARKIAEAYQTGKDSMEIVFDKPSYEKGRTEAFKEVRELMPKENFHRMSPKRMREFLIDLAAHIEKLL